VLLEREGVIVNLRQSFKKEGCWFTIMNLAVIIELQGPNSLNRLLGAMVDVDMNSMPPKIIGKEACLWAKGPLRLSKDLKPKSI
jgi:hypothetical protein